MRRPARNLVCALGFAAALAACNAKPTQEQCEQAVTNIRKVTGQSQTEGGSARGAAVRSCRAQSNRKTVECYIAAQSVDQLFQCGGELAGPVRAAEKKRLDSAGPAGGGAAGASGAGSGAGASAGAGAGAGAGEKPASGAGSGTGSSSGW
ncbi:MAG TPA: hypothetical protein VKB80_08085 [Kofleriaceae bacterium]|nr:hypothetical protein [Kofleriaceae bacterium]